MKTGTVLHVEDDEMDALLMQHAWKKAGLVHPLVTISDGEGAVRYLSGEGDYADRAKFPLPVLVLLDLKLPRMSGAEVLKWIRQHPAIHTLCVVVLSASNQPADIAQVHALRANAYLTKPAGLDALTRMCTSIGDFWLTQAQLPPDVPPPKAKRS